MSAEVVDRHDLEDEIDLRQLFATLWRRRSVIAAVTLIAVLASGVFSWLTPPTYEARAVLYVAQPAVQVGGPSEGGVKIATVPAAPLPADTVVAFAGLPSVSQAAAAKVLGGPGRLRALTPQAVRNTNLVELKVQSDDPEKAARVANEWANVVLRESAGLFATEAQQSYTFFEQRLKEAQTRLQAAEEAFRDFNARSRIGLLQARRDALTAQISGYESRLTDLTIALGRAETELSQTEAQMRGQPRTLVLTKSLANDPFLLQTVQDRTKGPVENVAKLNLRSEELNPVFVALDQKRADLSIRVAGLRAERSAVLQSLTGLRRELDVTTKELAFEQLRQSEFTRAAGDAKQVYDVLLQRREEARVASAAGPASVKLIAKATVPTGPVGPRKRLNMTLGGFLGLLAGCLAAFVVEWLQPTAQGRSSIVDHGSSMST